MAITLLLAGLTHPLPAAAQQASMQGIVTSVSTGGPLEAAVVVLESGGEQQHGTLTDRNGFYQIGGIEPGTYQLRGRYIGYAEHQQQITFARADRQTVNFRLETDVLALEGVVVSAGPGGRAAVTELGRQRVTPGDLRLVPVPAGSGDLATYLQTLPGVVTTGDRGGQFFVRGGTPAENMVLVDGIPIYQPFHILGFFSVFPEDLISSVDFYAGGFGSRYSGRTSSVLDVQMRDGNPNGFRGMGSVSPFIAEVLAEGPGGSGISWIASARRSLVEETSSSVIGSSQPLAFSSQLIKLSAIDGDDLRCSALALRTKDEGRLDPEERDSRVGWRNMLVGARCVALLERVLRLLEVNFSYSTVENTAVSRGSSRFRSMIGRMQHDGHTTNMIRSTPFHAGYYINVEHMDYDLAELFAVGRGNDAILGIGAYLEVSMSFGDHLEVRPGVALTGAPRFGTEPRLRASWQPFGRDSEKLHGAIGRYRQHLVGTSDMRDVGSVFTAWMRAPENVPLESLHALLGWQQSLGGGLQWSVEGYYKEMKAIPIPLWNALAQFTTRLSRADGEVRGIDTRVELSRPNFYTFVGYGFSRTEYAASQPEFETWFGNPVQKFHPPHDRRHQVNAVTSLDLAGFNLGARWQLGTGLPFTRPMGFEEAFDFSLDLLDVSKEFGTTRLVIDRPFAGRLPAMHRLDVSLERGFNLSLGRLTAQAGAINAYDRRNMFYYDLFSGRRLDQLPLAPYAALTFRSR